MFSFGSSAAAAAAATPATQQSTGLFSGVKFGATATTATTTAATAPLNLQFQAPKATLSVASTATSTTPAVGLGGSSALTAGAQSTTVSQSFSFGAPNATASGIGASASASITAKENIANPKSNEVPLEIIERFKAFKVFLKKQRAIGSEIACGSIKPAHDLKKEMNEVEKELIAADNDCKKVRKQIGLLKDHMIKLLRYVDLIQKQQSLIMQMYDNPVHHYNVNFETEFFTELMLEFEEKIAICKSQFDQIEQLIFTHYKSDKLTPEELTDCLQKVQEIFVSVAGKLHLVHSSLQAQKRNFLELRRRMFDDTRNPFDKSANEASQASWLRKVSKITPGPTPFSLLVQTHDMATATVAGVAPTNHF